jgi:hypothetical protein
MALSNRTDQELADLAQSYWEMGAELFNSFNQEEHLLHRVAQALKVLEHELTRRDFDFDEATYTGELAAAQVYCDVCGVHYDFDDQCQQH